MKTPKYIGLLAALTLTSISHLQSAIINWLETPESITISASGIGGFEEHPEFLSPSGNWKFTLRQRASSYFRQDGIRQFELETRSILTWLGDQSLIDPSLLGSGRPIIFTIPYIDFYRLDDDGSIMYFNGREFVERSPFFTTMSWRGLGWDGRATLTITDMPDLQDSSTWTWGAI